MNLEWTDAFLTGFDEIDEQHRAIFAYLRQLDASFQAPVDKKKLLEAIRLLRSESVAHFECEESCMNRVHCVAAAENKVKHAEFVEALDYLKAEVAKRDEITREMVEAILTQIADWVSVHILRVDRRLRACGSVSLPVEAALPASAPA